MEGWGPSTYGDKIADIYDEETRVSPDPAVDFLAPLALARRGRALELAIGTGRVALALAARGVEVYGIDASDAMVARMRAKAGGDAIPVTIGDFADVDVPVEVDGGGNGDGGFGLIFVVVSSIFALTSQEDQKRCFLNVARRLAPDGVFVVDAFVPAPELFSGGQRTDVQIELDEVELVVSRHERAAQRVTSAQVRLSAGGVRLDPIRIRYAWPSELDLMAELAGLRLRDRYGGWERQPFTDSSPVHISVYEHR